MSQYFLTNVGVDAILMVDATSGNEVVSLPRGYASGRKLTVRRKDSTGNSVTVAPPSGLALNGVTDGTVSVGADSEVVFVALETASWESLGLTPARLAQDPALIATYAAIADELAREQAYLAGVQAGALATRNLSTATISAWSAANAATGIASGVDVQTILNPGASGTLNPVFRYLRCAAAPRAVTATFPDNVTVKGFGLTSSATELMPLVLFNHSGGLAFEISIMGKGADQTKVRVSVDGAWINAAPLAGPANDGNNYRLTVTLPDTAQHEIGIEFSGYSAWFRRLTVGASAVVSRVQRNLGPRLIIVGDSQVEGANGTANVLGNSLGFAHETGRLLGIADTWASGLGNTGYVADNAGAYVTIGARITADAVNQAPDWVHLQAGQVDAGLGSPPSYATMLAAVTSVLTTLRTGLPNALITHQAPFRPYTTNQTAGTATTAGLNVRNAIRDACLAKSVPLIDVSAWLTGTGNTGATTGSGNADLYMSTDGVHLSPAGHLAAGVMLAARLKRGLNLPGIAG